MTARPLTDNDPRHGTLAGYKAHYTWKIPVCDPCRQAQANYRAGHRQPRQPIVYDIDEVAVWRALQGDRVPLNKGERREVRRQWLAKGRTIAELERTLGWRSDRYRTVA